MDRAMQTERVLTGLFLGSVLTPPAVLLTGGASLLFWALGAGPACVLFAATTGGLTGLWFLSFVGLVLMLAWERVQGQITLQPAQVEH